MTTNINWTYLNSPPQKDEWKTKMVSSHYRLDHELNQLEDEGFTIYDVRPFVVNSNYYFLVLGRRVKL